VKVWDCFTVGAEMDMLECHLDALYDVVDKFVVCESNSVQGDGRYKPLYYAENKERFAAYQDKIVHVIASLPPPPADAWAREHSQRDQIAVGLRGASDMDLIVFGDVDEIPSVSAIREASRNFRGNLFDQRCMCFAVDWELPYRWQGTCAFRYAWLGSSGSVAQARHMKTNWGLIGDGGFHFTWLGGPDGIRRKLAAHCHTEANEMIQRRLDAGTLYERGIFWGGSGPEEDTQCAAVEIDDTYPAYIRDRRCPDIWFRPR